MQCTWRPPRTSVPTSCSPAMIALCGGRSDTVVAFAYRSETHWIGFPGFPMHRTLDDIRREGLLALRRRLGRAGMIRFLQQFETGHGDYAADRKAWVDRISLED